MTSFKIVLFSSNSLGLGAPEEACSRNVRVSGTLKFGYEGIFKIWIIDTCKQTRSSQITSFTPKGYVHY